MEQRDEEQKHAKEEPCHHALRGEAQLRRDAVDRDAGLVVAGHAYAEVVEGRIDGVREREGQLLVVGQEELGHVGPYAAPAAARAERRKTRIPCSSSSGRQLMRSSPHSPVRCRGGGRRRRHSSPISGGGSGSNRSGDLQCCRLEDDDEGGLKTVQSWALANGIIGFINYII